VRPTDARSRIVQPCEFPFGRFLRIESLTLITAGFSGLNANPSTLAFTRALGRRGQCLMLHLRVAAPVASHTEAQTASPIIPIRV
jgi:hypothetical protein